MGIAVAHYLRLPQKSYLLAAAIALAVLIAELILRKRSTAFFSFKNSFPTPIFLLIIFFLLGAWRWQSAQRSFTAADLAFYNDQGKVHINGIICDDPATREKMVRLVICAESLEAGGTLRNLSGKTLVNVRAGQWSYGDRVELYSILHLPPQEEDFSYRDYLAQRGIYSLMEFPAIQLVNHHQGAWLKAQIFSLRRLAYQRVQSWLPQPEAGLLSGILLGIESDIPPALTQAFQDTGTAHIIAISGFNMTLIAGLLFTLLRQRLPIY